MGTPVKNSYSYMSASSPWYQKGRTEGEMTENRGEWSMMTEEREIGEGKEKSFPQQMISLLKSQVFGHPGTLQLCDAISSFTKHPLKCSQYSPSLHNAEVRLIQPVLPQTSKKYAYICIYCKPYTLRMYLF